MKSPININDPKSRTLLLGLAFALTVLLAAWTYSRVGEARDAAIAANDDLNECRDLVERMSAVRDRSSAASSSTREGDINQHIYTAASDAGLEPQVMSVEPGQPQRVQGTDYTELPVPLEIELVTLEDLVKFLHKLSTEDPAVRVRSISLAPPSEGDTSENWEASVTLAYLMRATSGRPAAQ